MKHRILGRGPAILFLHGFPTDGRLWEATARALSRAHTCVLVDLPGLGGSAPLPQGGLDPEAYVAALEELRDRLGLPAWHIVGHDAGATIAAHYAASRPARVRRLVLMAPPIVGDFRPPAIMRLLRLPLLGEVLAPLLLALLWRVLLPLALLRRSDVASRATLAGFAAPFRGPAGRRQFLRLVRWGDPAAVLGRIEAGLGAIQSPTLVLHGHRDVAIATTYARRAAAAIRGARLRLVDAGHFMALEEPRLVAAELAGFLDATVVTAADADAATDPTRSKTMPSPKAEAGRLVTDWSSGGAVICRSSAR